MALSFFRSLKTNKCAIIVVGIAYALSSKTGGGGGGGGGGGLNRCSATSSWLTRFTSVNRRRVSMLSRLLIDILEPGFSVYFNLSRSVLFATFFMQVEQ